MTCLFKVERNGEIVGSIYASNGNSAIEFFRRQIPGLGLGLWKASRI